MWSSPQKTVDLVTFTGEILNGKLQFFCDVTCTFLDLTFKISKKHHYSSKPYKNTVTL